MKQTPLADMVKGSLFGVIAGDAFGFPYQFMARSGFDRHPVTRFPHGMRVYSDDTALTLALMDALATHRRPHLATIMENMVLWLGNGTFSSSGQALDVGLTTLQAIQAYQQHHDPWTCGPDSEFANGNGALMRILPLSYHLYRVYGTDLSSPKALRDIREVTGLTHRHIRNSAATFLYLSMAVTLIDRRMHHPQRMTHKTFRALLTEGAQRGLITLTREACFRGQANYFSKFMKNPKTGTMYLSDFRKAEIRSSGYVLDSLEAAVWTLLNEADFRGILRTIINLGDDTDTIAAIAGGLYGLAYGEKAIPAALVTQIVGYQNATKIAAHFIRAYTPYRRLSRA